MKKNNKLIFVMILMLSLIFGLKTVNAAEKIKPGKFVSGPYYYKHIKGSKQSYEQAQFIVRDEDGAFVYCIQPLVIVNSNATYNVTIDDMASVANISYDNWKRIEKVAYYGYGYNENGVDHTADKWYVATAMLIWRLADPSVESYFTKTLNGTRDDTILTSEMEEINRLVDSHNILPKFDDMPTEMIMNSTITISDSNNVISNFTIDNIKGGNVTKNGNNLTIKATSVEGITFTISKLGNRYGEPTKLYYATDSQNVVRRGNIDPIRKNISIKVLGGTVTPKKVDFDTGKNIPKGEATLEGAEYGIYKEDGTRVSGVITNAEGIATSDYLPSLGRYFLLEEKAPEGYLIDDTKYFFEITEDNLNPIVEVKDKVISMNYEFLKVYASDKTGFLLPEVGILFGVYNNNGNKILELKTDSQGSMKFSLPYGNYTVKQLTTPKGHEKIEDFSLEVTENGEAEKKVLANAILSAKLKVIKIDAETKEVIKRKNIKFKIFNVEENDYVCQTITYPSSMKVCEYETDEYGEFITPYPLAYGTYRLEEVNQKIDGYLWNKESKEFTIDENTNLYTDSEYGIIFDIIFENKPVKGNIKIKKYGEELKLENNTYRYEKIELSDTEFEIIANEDIISGGKMYYKKGETVATIKTDEQGDATLNKDIPLGKYLLYEKKTEHNHLLMVNPIEFELLYEDQYTEKIVKEFNINNYYKKGVLDFTKTDLVDGTPIPGVEIKIFTEDDIEIFKGETDSEGRIIINNLPVRKKMYIIETKAAENYQITDEKIYFEILENGEVIKATMTNERTIIDVPDTDQSDNNVFVITGAGLVLLGIGVILYGKKKK